MTTITFDTTSVLALPELDGNVLMEIVAGVLRKKEYQDLFDSVFDTPRLTETGAIFGGGGGTGTVTEASNKIAISKNNQGGYKSYGFETDLTFGDGVFQIDFEGFDKTGTHEESLNFMLYVDANNYARISVFASNLTRAWCKVGGVDSAKSDAAAETEDGSFRITRSGNNFTFEYDYGGGWQTLATINSQAIGASAKLTVVLQENGAATDVDIMGMTITGTGVYWNNDPVATYTPDTSMVGSYVNFSATTGTFDVTTLIDVSLDGGSTWYAINKTLAEIQALTNATIEAGGLVIRTTHGNTTNQSDFTEIAFDVVEATLITFDSGDVLAQGTLDGNTTTEIDTGEVVKRLREDVFNSALATYWTEGEIYSGVTDNGSVNEAGGVIAISATYDGGNRYYGIYTPSDYDLDNDFEVIVDFDSFAATSTNAYAGLWFYLDTDNYIFVRRNKAGATNTIFARVRVGASNKFNTQVASSIASGKLRIRRSGTTIYCDYYDGSWKNVNSWNGALFSGAALSLDVQAGVGAGSCSVNFDNLDVTGPDTWPHFDNDPVVTYTANTSQIGGTIDFSETTATVDATTKFAVSVNGGSTFIGTDLDLAGVQALTDTEILAGGLYITTTHKNTTSQSGFTSIAFDVTPAATGLFPIIQGERREIISQVFKNRVIQGAF